MTGEQFLNSIRGLECEIRALKLERDKSMHIRQDLLERAESISAVLNGVCVQRGIESKTENIGVQLADLMTVEDVARKLYQYQEHINKRIAFLTSRKQTAQETIAKIADSRCRTLLVHRYVSNLKWATIADLMGYTDAYTRIDLKDQAVKEFDLVWQKQPS